MTDLSYLFRSQPLYNIKEKPIPYFGGNASQLLIFLEERSDYFFSSPHYYFLSQILKALGLTYSQVGLIEAVKAFSLEAAIQDLKPKKLIFFGYRNPLTSAAHYETSPYLSIPYLFGPNLDELYNNPTKKKQFWKALRKFIRS